MEDHFGKFIVAAFLVFMLWVVVVAANTKPRQPGYLISGNANHPLVQVVWGK